MAVSWEYNLLLHFQSRTQTSLFLHHCPYLIGHTIGWATYMHTQYRNNVENKVSVWTVNGSTENACK